MMIAGQENYNYKTRNFWWNFLAIMHAYIIFTTFFKVIQTGNIMIKTVKQAHNTRRKIFRYNRRQTNQHEVK